MWNTTALVGPEVMPVHGDDKPLPRLAAAILRHQHGSELHGRTLLDLLQQQINRDRRAIKPNHLRWDFVTMNRGVMDDQFIAADVLLTAGYLHRASDADSAVHHCFDVVAGVRDGWLTVADGRCPQNEVALRLLAYRVDEEFTHSTS